MGEVENGLLLLLRFEFDVVVADRTSLRRIIVSVLVKTLEDATVLLYMSGLGDPTINLKWFDVLYSLVQRISFGFVNLVCED